MVTIVLCFEKMNFRRIFHISVMLILSLTNVRGNLLECMIPLQHCMGNFLPIGYSMQRVDILGTITHLNDQCPSLGTVGDCLGQYSCAHPPTRNRVEAFFRFFTWICQNAHVLENNRACWEQPFLNDVIYCGETHISGLYGSHLNMPNHPCPYIQDMVTCLRERMAKRAECPEDAVELYTNGIILSSVAFSGCSP